MQYLGPAIAPTAGCNKSYLVQNGDRCWQLWTQFGLTEDNFTALNPTVNCSSLQIGQPVCVSSSMNVPPRAPCKLYVNIKVSEGT